MLIGMLLEAEIKIDRVNAKRIKNYGRSQGVLEKNRQLTPESSLNIAKLAHHDFFAFHRNGWDKQRL